MSTVASPSKCKVQYLDYYGKARIIDADDLLSTCIQHEVDHCDGILFIDYLSKLKKDMILGGWIGFLFGCFFTFLTISTWSIEILHGIATSMISILYGYVLGNVSETFWPYYSE